MPRSQRQKYVDMAENHNQIDYHCYCIGKIACSLIKILLWKNDHTYLRIAYAKLLEVLHAGVCLYLNNIYLPLILHSHENMNQKHWFQINFFQSAKYVRALILAPAWKIRPYYYITLAILSAPWYRYGVPRIQSRLQWYRVTAVPSPPATSSAYTIIRRPIVLRHSFTGLH